MDICTTSQFICSLKYPETRLRTLHNIVCDPETFLCNKHIAILQGLVDSRDYLFYAPITKQGGAFLRKSTLCATDSGYCDLQILENEIIYSGLSTGCCCLALETLPEGIRLSEAIYTVAKSRLLVGLNEFKAELEERDISHNNITLSNIVVDSLYKWHSICNYNLTKGFGNDEDAFLAIERNINNTALPDKPSAKTLEQLRLHSITTDSEGNVIYPIVESCRRFTSKRGVGFKDKHDVVIIKDDYLWASDFSSNRAVVQLKNSKMGVIDRKGRYIIQPLYTSIVYNPTDGTSTVNDGVRQTTFNYLGEQIDDWRI